MDYDDRPWLPKNHTHFSASIMALDSGWALWYAECRAYQTTPHVAPTARRGADYGGWYACSIAQHRADHHDRR